MKIFFRSAPLLRLIREGEERQKDMKAVCSNWMEALRQAFWISTKQQNDQDDEMSEPGCTQSFSPTSLFSRSKTGAQRG